MTYDRLFLRRPCACGHLRGDHSSAPPHPCLRVDRRNQVLFGSPKCTCRTFREPHT